MDDDTRRDRARERRSRLAKVRAHLKRVGDRLQERRRRGGLQWRRSSGPFALGTTSPWWASVKRKVPPNSEGHVYATQSRQAGRSQMVVQRVRRVIRKIDPWTVLKVSFVFNAVMALVFVLGTVIFWSIFVNAGIPERIDELALLIGLENGINLDGEVYFRVVALLAVIGTILMTGFFTLGAVMYNLISDLVGGIELIVLEETTAPRAAKPEVTLPTRTEKPARRAVLPSVKPLVRKPADETKEPRQPVEVKKTG